MQTGDIVAEVETDKATFTVESEGDGYVLEICAKEGESMSIGSILLWLGDTPEEHAPLQSDAFSPGAVSANRPTLKASVLLARYGLDPAVIPVTGSRLSVADIESYVSANHLSLEEPPLPSPAIVAKSKREMPAVPGKLLPLLPKELGMLHTVSWHHGEAATGYIEVPYDPAPWTSYARSFQEFHRLVLNPLLSLMAWRLVEIAKRHSKLNSTVIDQHKYVYSQVNLGFTVHSDSALYLVVVDAANRLLERPFFDRLFELQRRAMDNSLRPHEVTGSTIAFTSMARWNVSRHIPVLPRFTSLIVAHTDSGERGAALGATYDHRVLSGADVVHALRELSCPPGETS